jgi:HD-GYP domain-containing protein (c-di-GMP phosphodiesterase class II)
MEGAAPVSGAATVASGSAVGATRIVSALSSIFRSIFSAELYSNVCQLESGQAQLGGKQLSARGYYDSFFHAALSALVPGQDGEFTALFARKNLYAALAGGKTGICGEFCFRRTAVPEGSVPPKDPASASALAQSAGTPNASAALNEFEWLQVSAIRLSATPNGAVRCLLFLRPVANGEDTGRLPSPAQADTRQWERLRTKKLLGGCQTYFFEYDINSDTLVLHRDPGNVQKDRTVSHYLGGMDGRCDWTLFHEDIPAVKKLLQSAKTGSVEVRYRTGGDYERPFRWHRMQCAPLEDTGAPTQILGALIDIEDEVRLRNENRDMLAQIGTLLQSTFSQIFMVDTQRGSVAHVTCRDGVYTREKVPQRLSTVLRTEMSSGVIHPGSVSEYENWLKPGYLERAVGAGSYHFESRLRLPGSLEYRWYAESIICPNPRAPHSFLRLCRDVNEEHVQRQHNLELQEAVRLNHYNQDMLDALANVVEFRDTDSGQHICRVRELTMVLLADLSAREKKYAKTKTEIERIGQAAAMHDIGKIAIPDAILNKPGRLTAAEFTVMKTHTTRGAAIIDRFKLAGSPELKALSRDIALHHHERYDGHGYPEGLVGDQNSIAAQVVGLVDAYDALVSERCYKKPVPHAEALRMLENGECGAYNPCLIASMRCCAGRLHQEYEQASAALHAQAAAT